MRTAHFTEFTRLLAAGAVALTLAGCTTEQTAAPYAAEFTQAAQDASSDYVRSILDDGRIDAAELRDAQQQQVSCLAKAGIDAEYVIDGLGFYGLETADASSLTDSQRLAEVECNDHWMGDIAWLYDLTVANPDDQDMASLVADCLVRDGLVPDGFTARDYEEWLEASDTESAVTPDPDTAGYTEVEIDPSEAAAAPLPGGRTADDPAVIACLVAPLQH